MLSEGQQKRVWEGMLAAEIRANYFAELAYRYSREQRILTWSTLFLSSGAAVTLLTSTLPPDYQWLRPTFAVLAAALSLLSLVQQNQKRVVDSSDLHLNWNRLGADYESLWEDIYRDDAETILKGLTERDAELSKASTGFPNKKSLMLKWQNHVERQHGIPRVTA